MTQSNVLFVIIHYIVTLVAESALAQATFYMPAISVPFTNTPCFYLATPITSPVFPHMSNPRETTALRTCMHITLCAIFMIRLYVPIINIHSLCIANTTFFYQYISYTQFV